MRADWYEDAVVYSVDVETFYDADGDGVGDFRGLREKLPHIDRLGVDCIWLLPFYPTPNRDNGYDIEDYYGVDDRLGDLGDFTEFVDAAEERGIRVIADLVVNHTSDQHPWFQRAREDPDSKYRDYYVWTDDPENAPERTLVFPGEEEDVWRYDEVADAHYYHRFYHFQPDLNIANPAVREEIYKILRFWMSLGVSGFRVDAATLMIEPKGEGDLVIENPHQVFKRMKRTVRSARADGILLAEADDEPAKLGEYFGEGGDEMDLMLNFVLNAHVTHALATGSAEPIVEGLERLPDPGDRGRFANFLRNFDELNLGRLDEADQEVTYEAFAPEEHMRIYDRGIRRRLGAMLEGDRDRIAMAHSLLFSLPGTPVVVAGDEIGMGDELSLPGRNPVRTPIHWGDAPNAGFSTADADALVRPVIDEGAFGYDRVNVDAQRVDPDSLLNRIARLSRARDELPALKQGVHEVLDVDAGAGADTDAENVFAHRYDWEDDGVVCLHNLGTEATTVDLPGAGGVRVAGRASIKDGDVTLDRYEYCWVREGRP
ncbi:alpha-amylase family protein [Halobium salinum]|uniref:Alpha-amylase family protein n=1 Tax=Halobium salinum TaxID=1364940 RepID=A0ABD5PBJ5_9EURY|nr:alpha-amylase family protein [Halobium salinum]